MVQRAELELLRLIEEKPGDARIHNFLSSFYRSIGAIEQSREQSAIAASLSPNKPALVLEQAVVELQEEKLEEARVLLQKGFELEEKNTQARILYAAVLLRLGQIEEAKELIGEDHMKAFALNDYALGSAETAGDLEYLAELFTIRMETDLTNPQYRASLAFIYYRLEDIDKAIAILKQAGEDIPSFTEAAACYVGNLETGATPDEGCQP